jgi:hypothetical protein
MNFFGIVRRQVIGWDDKQEKKRSRMTMVIVLLSQSPVITETGIVSTVEICHVEYWKRFKRVDDVPFLLIEQ